MSAVLPGIRTGLFIANEWRPSRDGRSFETVNPSTEEVVASVARGGVGDIDDAVEAARGAFRGPWRRLVPADRSRLLYRVARVLESRLDQRTKPALIPPS